jgi:hypothetical protein
MEMTFRMRRLACALLILAISSVLARDGRAADPSGSSNLADLSFRLPTTEGNVVEFAAGSPSDLTVVCFLGTECPLARMYGRRLAGFVSAPEAKGVRFIGINSNQQDSMDELESYAAEYGIEFPMAKDYGNQVADRYGVERTPEVFLLNGDLEVLYRGRLDDQYLPGQTRPEPLREDLRIALREAAAGLPVSVPRTEPNGCLVGRVRRPDADSHITFTKQVSRILNEHCVECHREGEIGPFSLTDFEEVIGWADMIIETIDEGRMPPWHANPAHGEFANARHMPEGDKQALRDWVAAGTPYGDVAQLPEPPQFTDGWLLPQQPDLVLAMRDRPFVVPAEGIVEYQYYVVDPGFTEDKWVTAAEVIPGNRSVVHHSIVFIRPPDGADFRGVGWLTAYVPGQRTALLPPGYARFVPAGSKLVFQMHYTPNGTCAEDLTQVGLLFADDEDVTHEVLTLAGVDQEFEIPPHAGNYTVEERVRWLPDQGRLLAAAPHMHLRGKSFRLSAVDDAGRREILLDVPHYDFNWQHVYVFADPHDLASIADLEFTMSYDNSARNSVNPDPSAYVTWGDQSWEEMAIAFFEVARPRGAKRQPDPLSEEQQRARQARIDEFVEAFLSKFDANGDRCVAREETPLALDRFGFRSLDQDGDDRLTTAELQELARRKLSF